MSVFNSRICVRISSKSFFWGVSKNICVFPKIGGNPQNGWFIINGTPYEQMDDLGGKKPPLFFGLTPTSIPVYPMRIFRSVRGKESLHATSLCPWRQARRCHCDDRNRNPTPPPRFFWLTGPFWGDTETLNGWNTLKYVVCFLILKGSFRWDKKK